jgi:NhaA family Na+:H+ antiporter
MQRHKQPGDITLQSILEKKSEQILLPLEKFLQKQAVASLFLIVAIILALLSANLPWEDPIQRIAEIKTGFIFHHEGILLTIKEWVSSGLLALFFFLIGLEIKREIIAGKLQERSQVKMIAFAALGGMIFPALIYCGFTYNTPGAIHGWAIPMATDTAFAIGVLAVLAKRISVNVGIFLAALAIFDDIGAIIIVALFYSQDLSLPMLLCAIATTSTLYISNIIGLRQSWIYVVFGILLWWFMHASGVHATLAGVLAALAIPARPRISQAKLVTVMRSLLLTFEQKIKLDGKILESHEQHILTEDMELSVRAASTPLQRWEETLVNPVAIIVIPVFALLNAGISFSDITMHQAINSPIAWGIVAGLVIGKPLGIYLFCILGLWSKLGTLPENISKAEILGVGFLTGIGFTMSTFITSLSFEYYPQHIGMAKIGILLGSLASAILALVFLFVISRKKKEF